MIDIWMACIYDVFQIQITALCMCLSISAWVALGCLFAPKVYIVLFQPHKNVRVTVASALNPNSSSRRTFFGRGGSQFGALNGNGLPFNPSNETNLHDCYSGDETNIHGCFNPSDEAWSVIDENGKEYLRESCSYFD